ncbi:hypothetical protein [Zooshikella sp. RANM57]|uniref:hypothetical protein n=1 Tax=Zooshikella sp. RANM57 TaxID=3425863 RepID=UPI003D6FEB48
MNKKSVSVAPVTEIQERLKESATTLFTFHQKHDDPAMIQIVLTGPSMTNFDNTENRNQWNDRSS